MKYCFKMEPIVYPIVPAIKIFKLPIRQSDDFYIDHIMDAVCTYFQLTEEELKSSRRTRVLSDARTFAIYFIKKHLPKVTYKKLGEMFGNRDHSTMMYALDKFDELYNNDNIFRLDYEKINSRLCAVFETEEAA